MESGKLRDATVVANQTLAHFRALAQQSTQAHMLHVLHMLRILRALVVVTRDHLCSNQRVKVFIFLT